MLKSRLGVGGGGLQNCSPVLKGDPGNISPDIGALPKAFGRTGRQTVKPELILRVSDGEQVGASKPVENNILSAQLEGRQQWSGVVELKTGEPKISL